MRNLRKYLIISLIFTLSMGITSCGKKSDVSLVLSNEVEGSQEIIKNIEKELGEGVQVSKTIAERLEEGKNVTDEEIQKDKALVSEKIENAIKNANETTLTVKVDDEDILLQRELILLQAAWDSYIFYYETDKDSSDNAYKVYNRILGEISKTEE